MIDNREKVKILALAGRDHKVRISGDLAVITGALYFRAQMPDSDSIVTNDVFVTRVLMRKGDEWRFILYQATALAR